MKILFYDMGSYLYDDCLETLKEMGHEVRTVYYHFDNRYEDDFFCERFEAKVREIEPEIIFSVNFFPLVAKISHEHGLIYISWSCDSPLAEGLEEYFDYDTNRIWLFDRQEAEGYVKKGHKNVFHCPLAVNMKRLSAMLDGGASGRVGSGAGAADLLRKYACDVSFVGALYNASLEGIVAPLDKYLQGYIEALLQVQMEIYGTDILTPSISDEILEKINGQYRQLNEVIASSDGEGFASINKKGLAFAIQKQITFAERVTLIDTLGSMCDMRFYSTKEYPFESNVKFMGPVKYHSQMPYVFRASRINLCPTLRSIVSGIPLRSLDILACGGVLMSNWQPELAEYFVDGEDVIMYSSLEEAVDKAAWYLEHEDERMRIAGHALPILEREFDYRTKLEQIFSASLNLGK